MGYGKYGEVEKNPPRNRGEGIIGFDRLGAFLFLRNRLVLVVLFLIGDPEGIEESKDQAEKDTGDCGQGHSFQGDRSYLNLGAADSENQDDRREDQVPALAEVYLGFHQHPETRSGDSTEEEDGNTPHYGGGHGHDDGVDLAAEGEEDRENGGTADNPNGVNPAQSHDGDILAVGGDGHGTEGTGDTGTDTFRCRSGPGRPLSG